MKESVFVFFFSVTEVQKHLVLAKIKFALHLLVKENLIFSY